MQYKAHAGDFGTIVTDRVRSLGNAGRGNLALENKHRSAHALGPPSVANSAPSELPMVP